MALSDSTEHEGNTISEITIVAALSPFALTCNLQESDDRIPSFRVAIALVIPHFNGEFKYTDASIWFACGSFDQFLTSLNSVACANDGEASLADLSGFFNVQITNANGKYTAQFNVRQRDVNYPFSTLGATCRMERESVQYVFTQFKQLLSLGASEGTSYGRFKEYQFVSVSW